MFVDLKLASRPRLSDVQQKFLLEILPLAKYGETLSRFKSPLALHAPVLAAHWIIKSKWGKHPLSQPRYTNPHPDEEGFIRSVYANNLALLKASRHCTSLKIEYQGQQYRAYRQRTDFVMDFTDRYCWQSMYKSVLESNTPQRQIIRLSEFESASAAYCDKMHKVISNFVLWG